MWFHTTAVAPVNVSDKKNLFSLLYLLKIEFMSWARWRDMWHKSKYRKHQLSEETQFLSELGRRGHEVESGARESFV